MKRSASAVWHGNIKEGQGIISTESKAINNIPYSFAKRFGSEPGTNPEELIGAAHAGCFAMALSAELSKQNITADSIDVKAEVGLEKLGEGWSIPSVRLIVKVTEPQHDKGLVEQAAKSAKENCPVSKLLRAEITMDLTT